MTQEEQHQKLWEAISKPEKFSEDDLRSIRESLSSIPSFTSYGHVAIVARLNAEVIQALLGLDRSTRQLDKTSTDLINTTNKLTRRILWLTLTAVVISVASLTIALLQLLKSRLGL